MAKTRAILAGFTALLVASSAWAANGAPVATDCLVGVDYFE